MSADGGKTLSVDCRRIRDLGNAYGFSLDKNALKELGVLDEQGNVKPGIFARIEISDNGTVNADFPIDEPEP